ncbi:hypothetical protein [Bradyrhizobium sp. AS23.2]|uniref:hypothetical protein n=1 Tax=Bradyrhizobium sp. AS23.2 TaxID=1680155 RepID=UPI00093A0FFA|nr:hypothetical protein [Bradyrhizobium sp. AS23.2]OKO73570.1 hypothetical protein AC630_28545 [Bradyrhizobium sp. AS23.2]
MLQIKIEEKKRTLVRRDAADELIDQIAGTTLTHLSGMAARCSRDLAVRRNIDAVVDQVRREIASACLAKANEWSEPPLRKAGLRLQALFLRRAGILRAHGQYGLPYHEYRTPKSPLTPSRLPPSVPLTANW